MARTNTFSLYLAKSHVLDFDELLTESARTLLDTKYASHAEADLLGDKIALFAFTGKRTEPPWVAHLKEHFSLTLDLKKQSPCAIVAFRRMKRIFLITFSYAHVYINEALTEPDFGLKVAVNFVSDEKLMSVERANIAESIREFTQAASHRNIRSFGLDEALDLIRKVSGYSAEKSEFADKVTGARALRFSKKIEMDKVPDAAESALALFRSNAYKDTAFKIIDFLSPLADPEIQAALDQKLVESIKENGGDFEISLPEILPDDVRSFRFERMRASAFHADLSVELYRDALSKGIDKLTCDQLNHHQVAAYDLDDTKPTKRWSVYQALVGSLLHDRERYAINEGHWYHIGEKYKEAAEREFIDLCRHPDEKLRTFRQLIPDRTRAGRRDYYQSEGDYNREVAKEAGYLLLDSRLIEINDIPGPGLEVCDLFDIEGRRLIHVKKSSRQSSVLSHFFKQGCNSAQMIKKYEAFKLGVVDVVGRHYDKRVAAQVAEALADRLTVDFQIADYRRANGQHNIPFFSKLTLRDEARTINAMGFDVNIGFITLARAR